MWRYHEREAGSYCDRLNRFLSDPYLRFNPYRLDDEALVAAAMRQKWGDEFSLTKMLVIEFLEVAEIPGGGVPREIVRYRIGNYSDVIEERMAEFTCRSPARDSMRQIRHTINGRSVTQSDQIHALAGKKVFVSRAVGTRTPWGTYSRVLSMHRLNGHDNIRDAAIIRKTMMDAKFEMLDRLEKYHYADVYLDGMPSPSVDISPVIAAVRNRLARYPEYARE